MDNYLKGELSPEEQELLQQWYDSFGESAEGVPGVENEKTIQTLKVELDTRIRQAVKHSSLSAVPTRKLKKLRWVAATMLIAALGSVLLLSIKSLHNGQEPVKIAQSQTFQQVKTGIRQIKKLRLPDGSVIHLNANSAIRIPTQLRYDKRTVFLDEGEAYFEVARDSLRPFIVQTQTLRVEVLGTSFNVKSYESLKDVTVAVQKGRVRVSDTTQVLGELATNKRLIYRKIDGHKDIVNLTATDADAWIRGVVRLEKADFDELAQALYNLHGVRLKSEDPHTAYYHYNMNLRSDRSLQEIMDVICNIHHTNYRRKGDEITIYP